MERDPDGQIKCEVQGHLLLIGIDRPEKRNGFTPKIFAELAAAYTRLESTHELRCGVLYAEGDHFTAGLDMPKIAPLRKAGQPLIPPSDVDPFNLREPIRTKPLVIALKGICFTVAIELMLAADIAIAARELPLLAARGQTGNHGRLRGDISHGRTRRLGQRDEDPAHRGRVRCTGGAALQFRAGSRAGRVLK